MEPLWANEDNLLSARKDRIKSTGLTPCLFSQLILDKGPKDIQWEKVVFSTSGAGKTGETHAEK